MQVDNKFIDDLARVATGALGTLAGARQEVETRLREQFERFLANMDLVTREEFEVVQAMAVKAREEQETLAGRCALLEARLEKLEGVKPKTTRKRAAPKTTKTAAKTTKKKAAPRDA